MCIRWRHVPCHHLGEEIVEGLVGVGDQQSALTRTVVVQHLYTKTPSTASTNSVRRVPTSHRIHSIIAARLCWGLTMYGQVKP